LLVEDEKLVREVAVRVLRTAGYRVIKARDGKQAINAFRKHRARIQLLLTDVVLPGRNGCGLAEHLRALEPSLRIIFISGYPLTVLPDASRLNREMCYLPKPFSANLLTEKVRQALKQSLGGRAAKFLKQTARGA
jgi:two-component system, cell cycle sensor histidine kinase and response regulator CckA